MKEKKLEQQTGSDFKFLYWDDLGDSQDYVDNQNSTCSNYAKQQDEDERIAEERMMIIMRNGNSGEHYFNNHSNSVDVWDDEEEQDVE